MCQVYTRGLLSILLSLLCISMAAAQEQPPPENYPGLGTCVWSPPSATVYSNNRPASECLGRADTWWSNNGWLSAKSSNLTRAPDTTVMVGGEVCTTKISWRDAFPPTVWVEWHAAEASCPTPPEPEQCESGSNAYFVETSPPFLNYQPPSLVCDADCRYAYSGSAYNEDGSITNLYHNTAGPCLGEEDQRELTPADDTEEPPEEECNTFDNVIMCYPPDSPPNCYLTTGAPITCPGSYADEDADRCGFIAGEYVCVDTDNRSCGTFNGEFVCFARTSNGQFSSTPIPRGSPDHPLNGGNANGNPNDDVFRDETDVANNALSPQDVQRELQRSGIANANGGVEFDDSGIIAAVNEVRDTLKLGVGSGEPNVEVPTADDIAADIASAMAGLPCPGCEFISNGHGWENTTAAQQAADLGDSFLGIFPQSGSCSLLTFPILPSRDLVLEFDSCQLGAARTVLEFMLYAATLMAGLFIVLPKREGGKQ